MNSVVAFSPATLAAAGMPVRSPAIPAAALSLVLPLPPTANKLWAPVRTRTGAKLVKRQPYADWSAQAKREVAAQRNGICVSGVFAAVLLLPDDGPWDLDNLIKPLMDACQHGGAIANDRLCRRLWIDADDTRAGTALIEICPISPAGSAPGGNQDNARMETSS